MKHHLKMSLISIKFHPTVFSKKKGITSRQVAQADKARSLYGMLGPTLEQAFRVAIDNNMIHNGLLTSEDVKQATAIHNPDVVHLQGVTVKIQGQRVETTTQIVPLPAHPSLSH
jgi:hypothetical protein